MELVEQLLAILAGPNSRLASQQLMALGHTEDEIRGAWNFRQGRRILRIDRIGKTV